MSIASCPSRCRRVPWPQTSPARTSYQAAIIATQAMTVISTRASSSNQSVPAKQTRTAASISSTTHHYPCPDQQRRLLLLIRPCRWGDRWTDNDAASLFPTWRSWKSFDNLNYSHNSQLWARWRHSSVGNSTFSSLYLLKVSVLAGYMCICEFFL